MIAGRHFVTDHEAAEFTFYLEPGYELCLNCPLPECVMVQSPLCPRHDMPPPPPDVGGRPHGKPHQAIRLPVALRRAAVKGASNCAACRNLRDCQTLEHDGGMALCERSGLVFAGGVTVTL